MKVVSGVDLVYIPRFKKALKSGGENFLRRVFNENELLRHLPGAQGRYMEGDTQHLAGIFAAKEAVIKALSLPTNSWHNIQIKYQKNGSPTVKLTNHSLLITNHSLSISHDKNYVIAQFVAIIR